jgi:hypothetical protein
VSEVKAVSIKEVGAFASACLQRMRGERHHARATPLSTQTKEMIKRRLPPNMASRMNNVHDGSEVIDHILIDVGTRISAYANLPIYQELIRSGDQSVRATFLLHLHSLRANEVYLILELGGVLLRLMSSIETDAGLPAGASAARFERRYKATFKDRLRERHRLTHKHEHDSFEQALIRLCNYDVTGEIVAKLLEKLDHDPKSNEIALAVSPPDVKSENRFVHGHKDELKAYVIEGRTMWEMLKDEILSFSF